MRCPECGGPAKLAGLGTVEAERIRAASPRDEGREREALRAIIAQIHPPNGSGLSTGEILGLVESIAERALASSAPSAPRRLYFCNDPGCAPCQRLQPTHSEPAPEQSAPAAPLATHRYRTTPSGEIRCEACSVLIGEALSVECPRAAPAASGEEEGR